MKKWFPSLTLLFLLSAPSLLFADSLSLTTYYPAPFGAYSLLKLTPNTDASMGACNTSKIGMIYLSSDTNEFKTCNGTSWGSVSPWSVNLASKIVYLTYSDTDTAYKTGIGVLAPNARFHVKGLDDDTYGQIEIESTENDAQISFHNSAGLSASGNGSILVSNTLGNEGMRFQLNHGDRMVIDENGRVGIGIDVSNPDTYLHVFGNDDSAYGQVKVESAGADARISLYNSNGAATTGRGDIMMSRTAGSEGLRFLINNADKMIVDESGNVGIGITAPTAVLDVSANPTPGPFSIAKFNNLNFIDDNDVGLVTNSICVGTNCTFADNNFLGIRMIGDPSNVYDMRLSVPWIAGYASTVSMNVGTVSQLVASSTAVVTDNSVNVGIGESTPDYKLHVNGPIGGKLDSAHPATVGELQVNCSAVPGKCYATYAP